MLLSMENKTYKHLEPITREWVLSQIEKHGMTERGNRDQIAYSLGIDKTVLSSWLSENKRGFKSGIHKAAFKYYFESIVQQKKIRLLELEIKYLKGEIS